MTGGERPWVVLTRPAGKNAALVNALQAHGVAALDLPALQTHPVPPDPVSFPRLEGFDLVVFVSRIALTSYQWQHGQLFGASATGGAGRAVLGEASTQTTAQVAPLAKLKTTLQTRRRSTPQTPPQMSSEHYPSSGLRPRYLAAVGPSTAVALARFDQAVAAQVLAPPPEASHDSEGLWQALQPHLHAIQDALIVRGQTGRDWLGEQLVRAGINVVRHASYARLPADWTPAQVSQLAVIADQGLATVWLLTSVHGVDAIFDQLGRHQLLKLMANARFVAIHERIAQRLKSQIAVCDGPGAHPAVTLCATDNASMADALVAMAR
ncbi:uroporphyrinogen-III synthase [Pusillimonas minor]|uniref:Uroporphyrinogen-III synthase n=1 Tax=Pusillimonas minor TaxID=2697024 RepID=A0A842HTQ1_9BURK|nr:uroporphyrinogen-III synthase [Pusillimonas minor]MBC2771144.1 uroporphyrinogen-III synthase [Pusillimonas minor]